MRFTETSLQISFKALEQINTGLIYRVFFSC